MTVGWREMLERAPASARILVVDDEESVRDSLVRLLKRLGHTAEGAVSAEAGEHRLSTERFDVLLLDIDLPGMKGDEFLDRALEHDGELAVIMLTALDDPVLALECLRRGARTYLVKPVEEAFLQAAIRDALAVRRLLVEWNERLDA